MATEKDAAEAAKIPKSATFEQAEMGDPHPSTVPDLGADLIATVESMTPEQLTDLRAALVRDVPAHEWKGAK